MAGPIISGGSPKTEVLLFLLLFIFACVLLSPHLTHQVLSKVPWLEPFFNWMRKAP